ncbi:hypothetical protein KEJ50_00560 [Candidatus Bathyarchaeota archaeon]|nr:hypothetical protein [Candidatus Bathyarchaeota archaeon]
MWNSRNWFTLKSNNYIFFILSVFSVLILFVPLESLFLKFFIFNLSFSSALILFKKNALKKPKYLIILFLPLILSLSLLMPASKAALITEYSVPIDYRPHGVAVSGGNIWFTAQFANKICMLSGSTIYEWNVPEPGSEPYEIAVDSEGQVWFTEYHGDRIGRFKNPVFAEFKLTSGSSPTGIAIDKNVSFPNVWFTEFGRDYIGKIYFNTTGGYWVIVEYEVPTTSTAGPMDIAVSPIDSLVWFTEYHANKICSFNPWTLVFKEYSLPGLSSGPWHPREIIVDDNGFVWFSFDSDTSLSYDKIGKLNPWSGELTFYDIPTQGAGPRSLIIDKDGAIWFSEYDKGKIGRLNPVTQYITEFTLSDPSCKPWGIAIDASKNPPIWFTEWTGNKIGRVDPTTGTTISTVTTITSATTTPAIAGTGMQSGAAPVRATIYSTTTGSPTATFTTAAGTSSTNRYATSTVSVNTETIFVIPTTITTTTTSFISHISSTSTTLTATLTTYVSTVSKTTSTTITTIFYTPVGTETVITTKGLVFTDIVATTTISEFAATSYSFKTTTLPFYTSYITSTITELTTLYTTSTLTMISYATVTTTITLPLILASIFAMLLIYYKRKRVNNGGK